MPLYHASTIILRAGSIVEPGNYGRIILAQGRSHPRWAREMTLEAFRSQHFPNKPSRLQSTFCCDTVEAIRFYRAHLAKTDVLYEVEHVDAEPLTHRACFNAVDAIPSIGYTLSDAAAGYWHANKWFNVETAPNVECAEIISTSAIRILNRID